MEGEGMRPKKVGCDGAGLLDEFGPKSWWAHGFTLWEILADDAAVADGSWFGLPDGATQGDEGDSWNNEHED